MAEGPPPDAPWHLQNFAGTREATNTELVDLTADLATAAVAAGYDATSVNAAKFQATVASSPRGTKVGRVAAVLDDTSVIALTKEYGQGKYDRQALDAFWTDGVQAMGMQPSAHATALRAGHSKNATVMAANATCCIYPGASLGTCCTFNIQGLFECCAPCGFTLAGGIVAGIACILVWCNYCYAAHCTQWYSYC